MRILRRGRVRWGSYGLPPRVTLSVRPGLTRRSHVLDLCIGERVGPANQKDPDLSTRETTLVAKAPAAIGRKTGDHRHAPALAGNLLPLVSFTDPGVLRYGRVQTIVTAVAANRESEAYPKALCAH